MPSPEDPKSNSSATKFSKSTTPNPEADAILLSRIRKHLADRPWKNVIPKQAFMAPWFDSATISSASTSGHMTWRFPVLPFYINQFGGLAGGAQSAMHDYCTSWAMLTVARKGFWMSTGLTRALNMTYLRAAKVGEMLVLECEVVQAGRRVGLVRGVLRREKDGEIVSTSEHHKINIDGEAKAKL